MNANYQLMEDKRTHNNEESDYFVIGMNGYDIIIHSQATLDCTRVSIIQEAYSQREVIKLIETSRQ